MKLIPMRILYFITLCCLNGVAFFISVPAQAAQLSEGRIRAIITEELNYYDQILRARDNLSLINHFKKMTHDDSIFYVELNLKMAGLNKAAAPQNHHFNREPFLKMLENAVYLNPDDFEMSFRLGDINVQYDGTEAIALLNGTAKGTVTEPVSGLEFLFNVTNYCRINIRSNPLTYISYDSIACRMNVDYMPYTTNAQAREIFFNPDQKTQKLKETWIAPQKINAPDDKTGQE